MLILDGTEMKLFYIFILLLKSRIWKLREEINEKAQNKENVHWQHIYLASKSDSRDKLQHKLA